MSDTELLLTANQREIRFTNRRRMAWLSFACLSIVGSSLLFMGIQSDETAFRIEKLSFLLGTLFGCWATVILSYYGASTYVNGKLGK